MPDLEQSRRGMAGRLPDPNQSNPCHATPKTISGTPVNCQREARVRTRTHSHARTCCLSAHAGSESGCRRNGKTLFTVAVAEGREQQNYRGNEGGREGRATDISVTASQATALPLTPRCSCTKNQRLNNRAPKQPRGVRTRAISRDQQYRLTDKLSV